MNSGIVYIISNTNRTTLYIGVTNNLDRRMLEHKAGLGSKFAAKYNLHYLLFFERFENITDAISYEKRLKNWHKEWKWNLIEKKNSEHIDLAKDWYSSDEILDFKKEIEENREHKKSN